MDMQTMRAACAAVWAENGDRAFKKLMDSLNKQT